MASTADGFPDLGHSCALRSGGRAAGPYLCDFQQLMRPLWFCSLCLQSGLHCLYSQGVLLVCSEMPPPASPCLSGPAMEPCFPSSSFSLQVWLLMLSPWAALPGETGMLAEALLSLQAGLARAARSRSQDDSVSDSRMLLALQCGEASATGAAGSWGAGG